MKSLRNLAAVLVGLALACLLAPAATQAACTLPHTLTNGTTADATQVMANYNTLRACLETLQAATAPSGGDGSIASPVLLGNRQTSVAAIATGGASFYAFVPRVTGVYTISVTVTQAEMSWSLYTGADFQSGSVIGCEAGLGVGAVDVICTTPSLNAGTIYYLKVRSKSGSDTSHYKVGVARTEDLDASALVYSGAGPISFDGTITNNATHSVYGNLLVYWYFDFTGTPTRSDPPDSMTLHAIAVGAGASTTVTSNMYACTSAATGTAYMLIDPQGDFADSSLSNNVRSASWTCP